MDILVITDSYPIPPKNGKDLPIFNIFSHISSFNTVDILVLNSKKPFNPSKEVRQNTFFNKIYSISYQLKRKNIRRKIYNSYEFSLQEVVQFSENKLYDWVWASPYPCFGFINFCFQHKIKLFKKAALGLNDELSNGYHNRFYKMLRQKSYTLKGLGWLIQSWHIKKEEKKVFSMVDLVHLQTEKEKKRLLGVVGYTRENDHKIIVAPNGLNENLLKCNYSGVDSEKILCMTQLGGGRKDECKWFFLESWPIIKKSIPTIQLLIVGSPPNKSIPYLENDSNIKILGYVSNLEDIFNSVALSVVPTFHNSGLINRIQDSIVAGVPTITTEKALETFTSLQNGKDISATQSSHKFAEETIKLYKNRALRIERFHNSKIISSSFPNWENTATKIYNKLKE